MGRISQEISAIAGSFFGVTMMALWDRSETDLYDALRRQRNKIYRHLIMFEIRHFYFKEKIYQYTMYILFSVLSYKVHWHRKHERETTSVPKCDLLTHISRFLKCVSGGELQ